MSAYVHLPARGSIVILAAAFQLFGCAGSPDASRSAPRGSGASAEEVLPVQTYVDARPMAIADGRAVNWGDLRPILTELAGNQALEEILLDRRLTDAAEQAGIRIGEEQLAAERRRMLESLNDDPATAVRLLNELRARQGLGTTRFDALVRRNATLRAMVQPDIRVTDDAIGRMFRELHGERRQGRIIVTADLSDAQQLVSALRGGAYFGDTAVQHSTDSSAVRGGLLEPISRVDARYPDAVRSALWSLHPGEISDPILLDGQFAILQLEMIIPPDDVRPAAVRDEIAAIVRAREERMAMDALADRLLSSVTVTVFDEGLEWSWRRR